MANDKSSKCNLRRAVINDDNNTLYPSKNRDEAVFVKKKGTNIAIK